MLRVAFYQTVPFNGGMVGTGRPPIGQRIVVRIPTDLLEQIDRDAHNNGRKRAEQIRLILTNNYSKDTS